jgi:hypothetical protein
VEDRHLASLTCIAARANSQLQLSSSSSSSIRPDFEDEDEDENEDDQRTPSAPPNFPVEQYLKTKCHSFVFKLNDYPGVGAGI